MLISIGRSLMQRGGLWVVLGIATLLRCTGLVRRDFWYDEAFTGVAIQQSWHNMMVILGNDVHPPLYYILVKVFAMPFNYSVFGIRLFSAVFGVLAVWAVYRLAKELFSATVAWYAALLTTISPFAIQYSQEARMYSLLATLIVLAAYYFVLGLKTQQSKYFVWWGIFTGLSFLTHYISIFFAVLYYVAYVFWNKPKHWKNFLPAKKLLLGYALAGLVFLPWAPQFLSQLQHSGGNLNWVAPAHLGDIPATIQMFLFGTPLGELSAGMPQANLLSGIQNNSIQTVIAVLLTLAILIIWRRTQPKSVTVLLVWSIGFMTFIYLLSVLSPHLQYFVSRYLSPAAYFLFVVIAVALVQLHWRYRVVLIGVYLALMLLIVPRTNSQGFNALAQNSAQYHDRHLYVLSALDYVLARYYVGADNLTLYNKEDPQYNPSSWAAIGSGLQRTEQFADIQSDPKNLILSLSPLDQSSAHFDVTGLHLVQQYNNLYLYSY